MAALYPLLILSFIICATHGQPVLTQEVYQASVLNFMGAALSSNASSNFTLPTYDDVCLANASRCYGTCVNGTYPAGGYTCLRPDNTTLQVDRAASTAFELVLAALNALGSSLPVQIKLRTINDIQYDLSKRAVTYKYGLAAPLDPLAAALLPQATQFILPNDANAPFKVDTSRIALSADPKNSSILVIKLQAPGVVTVGFGVSNATTNASLRASVVAALNLTEGPLTQITVSATLNAQNVARVDIFENVTMPQNLDYVTLACTFVKEIAAENPFTFSVGDLVVLTVTLNTTDSGCAFTIAPPPGSPSGTSGSSAIFVQMMMFFSVVLVYLASF